jgi:hypothetical protein
MFLGIKGMTIEGQFDLPDELDWFMLSIVSSDYLRVLGITIKRGRGLTERDRAGAPLAALVNESFVRRFYGGEDAVGRRLGDRDGLEIVGVVGDVRQRSPFLYGGATHPRNRGANVTGCAEPGCDGVGARGGTQASIGRDCGGTGRRVRVDAVSGKSVVRRRHFGFRQLCGGILHPNIGRRGSVLPPGGECHQDRSDASAAAGVIHAEH